MTKIPLWVAAAALLGLTGPAAAQVPVALVEKADANLGVALMDYVTAGQVIDLGRNGTVVLNYLNTCVRETVTGGTLIALDGESLVQGGRVERTRPRCDAARLRLDSSRATQSAGAVYRSGPASDAAAPAQPLVLHGRSPLIQVDAMRSALSIRRLDQAEAARDIAITDRLLVAGRFVDLAKAGIALQPGGRYRATLGSSTVDFAIDADAAAGTTPPVGRLLRFP